MLENRKLGAFNFYYDRDMNPCVLSNDHKTLVFMSADYSEIVLKIHLKENELNFAPSDAVHIIRKSNDVYKIINFED
ncbi:hypothetical protein DY102_04205 [Apilactobacillus timberlakei]|uniref:hypothetical protein n=1 Tax=Apilactobacillus timberlakei TaxID=2008380 RepID=UPI00112AE7D4|nr:hypothetical protein [Apilactobacillus timberlakei]TPR23252.1 hypothetical protein DY102_04205 [Apilactobacillus timberlakei]